MTEEQIQAAKYPGSAANEVLSQKLDAVRWALFFIWFGIAALVDVSWGLGLIGVAVIFLGEAVVRRFRDLNIEGFWVVIGFMFLVGGLWELFRVPWPLAPILFIGCGLAVLWGAVSGKHMMMK